MRSAESAARRFFTDQRSDAAGLAAFLAGVPDEEWQVFRVLVATRLTDASLDSPRWQLKRQLFRAEQQGRAAARSGDRPQGT